MPETDLSKAVIAGAAAGLAGAWAMSEFSRLWERAFPRSAGAPGRNHKVADIEVARQQLMHASQPEWDSTMNAATALARDIFRQPLTFQQRERGAVAIHYAAGATMAAAFAVIREFLPEAAASSGAAFGIAVWLLAQEIGMPLLGWAPGPRGYSVGQHANSLGEHVAYGVTTELVRRVLRKAL